MDKNKLLSGRYFLTICGGLGFLWCIYAKLLTAGEISTIITMIFVSYFQRNRNGEGVKNV